MRKISNFTREVAETDILSVAEGKGGRGGIRIHKSSRDQKRIKKALKKWEKLQIRYITWNFEKFKNENTTTYLPHKRAATQVSDQQNS